MRIFSAFFLAFSLLGAPAFAADPDAALAQTLYQNGARLYEEGQYEQAIAAFEEAYRLAGEPLLLYNQANAYERLGNAAKALEMLQKYRIYASADEQDVLLARCQALERRVEAEKAAVAAVTAVPLAPSVAPPAPSLPPPLPAEPVRRSPAPWVVATVGGVLAAAGGAVAGGTWSIGQHDIDSGDQDGFEAVRPLNNAAVGTAIAGGAVGVGGIVWGVARGGDGGGEAGLASTSN